jgi:hypothetical protein
LKETFFRYGSFFPENSEKEERLMKDNKFATNQGGVIKAPKPVKDSPKSTVTTGKDLRNGKGK